MNFDIAYVIYQTAAIAALAGVSLFPVWLGRHNGLGGYDMARVMTGSILLGWTIFGWVYAVWLASNIKFIDKK
ncbi:MAG: hypothetical protein LBG89_00535 [Rickettsiales bacterium]|jgi:hypothetical protein|nr:hypothetical protein [Rickettsiales bacterium]